MFIRRYANIITPLETILNMAKVLQWTPECDKALKTLKDNLNTTPIMIFSKWENEFHVHVYASGIALGSVLVQLGDGAMDHPIYFASSKLSQAKCKHTTT
jgi:hypothetical protein